MRRDQRGSSLVGAVGVLSMMTLLATLSLMAGGADLVLSTRLARGRSAFYAAESALETTLAELGSPESPVPETTFHAPWPDPGVAARDWQDGEWACSRRIGLIPDVDDRDGDPGTTVVLFDRSFGHAASPRESGGFPVLQVLVAVRGGESRQAIVAEVAPVTCAPVVNAAWTAAGPLSLSGDVLVAGGENFPAVAGRTEVRLLEGAAIDGEHVADPLLPLPTDALEILNGGGTLPRLESLDAPSGDVPLQGLLWSRGDYAGRLDGEGVLVVHNPGFDPVKHEASRIAIEEGVFLDERDPAYSHLDPARQPARLDILVGGSFTGVIIADVVGCAAAGFTLTGALVTLSRGPVAVTAPFPLRINGSLSAISRAGRGALRHVVGFRPVAALPDEAVQTP